jgi:hypothetical protein
MKQYYLINTDTNKIVDLAWMFPDEVKIQNSLDPKNLKYVNCNTFDKQNKK